MFGVTFWYGGISQPKESEQILRFLSVSSEEITVALIVNMITYPLAFLLSYLFKHAKPKRLRENRIIKLMEERCKESNLGPTETGKVTENKHLLPFYCSYISWFIVLLCTSLSLLIVFLYGATFENDRLYKWFSTFMLSFVASFLIFEPLKVSYQMFHCI